MVNGQTYRDFDQLTIDQSITTENWWLVNGQTHRVFDQLTNDQLTNISMRGVWVTQKKIETANSKRVGQPLVWSASISRITR